MPGRDIVVVGASAGGVETLVSLVRGLPATLPSSLFVVLHLPANAPSMLAAILERAGRLPTENPRDGEAIAPGRIYVAPPGRHLLLRPGYIRLVHGPRENGHRPAADPLFRTAAAAYGQRVVGIVLSGTLDDGTAGLLAVKRRGGIAVVQDPAEALFDGMPRSALDHVQVDYCVKVEEMPALLLRLATEQIPEREVAVADEMGNEERVAELDLAALNGAERSGRPSTYSCPDCGGTLWELEDGDLLRFRCRVGHAFSVESLLGQQDGALENALWAALRALEERAAFLRRLAERAREGTRATTAERFADRALENEARAAVVRDLLLKLNGRGAAGAVNAAEGAAS